MLRYLDKTDLHSDLELFRLTAEDDEEAFRELFDKYVPKMRPVVRAIVGMEAPVKDIIQDVFLLIWISRQKLPEVLSPESWIFRIVHYESYKWLRRRAVREKTNERFNNLPNFLPSNPTEEYTSFEETARLLREAVAGLPPQAQKIYRLRRESDMKIDEIAVALGLAPQTVKNTLTRALQAIQRYLEQHGIIIPLFLLGFFAL